MSPLLDSLSVELLDNILSFVHPPSALCKLALVSWKFNSLATPHLYRHIFLESDGLKGGFTHMLTFTFLMLRKPSIASLVRSFTFRGEFHTEDSFMIDPNSQYDYHDVVGIRSPWPDHPELDGILRRVIEEVSHSEEEESEWHREVLPLYAPKDIAIFPLLLITFTNLRRLDMEILSLEPEVDFLERTFNRIAFSEPPFDVKPVFTQLTDIMIAGNDDRYPTVYGFFTACCRLPAVKRLYGHRLGAETDWSQPTRRRDVTSQIVMSELHGPKLHLDDSPQSSGLGTATVTDTFELRNSKLRLADLPIIFGALRSPQTIIYHIGNFWVWTPVQTPEILSAIAIHATSLHRLAMDHEDDYPFEPMRPDDNADPLSFADFIALTHLRVAPVFLFGYKDLEEAPDPGSVAETTMQNRLRWALPPNLESLYITNADFVFGDYYAYIAKAFEVLLRHKDCVPHLRELVFEGEFEGQESKQLAGRVVRLAEEMGVDASVISLPQNKDVKERGWGWDEKEVSFETCIYNEMGERVQVLPLPKLS